MGSFLLYRKHYETFISQYKVKINMAFLGIIYFRRQNGDKPADYGLLLDLKPLSKKTDITSKDVNRVLFSKDKSII